MSFDPTITYTCFDKFVDVPKNDRQRRNFETLLRHTKAEVYAELDTILSTLVPDPQYHEWGVVGDGTDDTGPKGMAAVQAHYQKMVETGSYVIESDKIRVVMSDDTIVTEATIRQILSAPLAVKLGFLDEPGDHNYYVLTARQVVFWPFDEEGRSIGEDRYVVGNKLEPMADDELPSNFPAQLRVPLLDTASS